MKSIVIAIDGPAASGKSTTAKLVAARLGLFYLDTGAMYRAISLKGLRKGIDLSDGAKVAEMTKNTKLSFKIADGEQRIIMDGEDVSADIRTPEVTAGTTPVSSQPQVRKILVNWQQEMGKRGGVVAEGRDTTSVVFPDADLKIYLIADINARAERRVLDLRKMGVVTTAEEQGKLISQRDNADAGRETSPLTKVAGAIEIDTSKLTIEQQVQRIIDLAHEVAAV